MATKLPIPFGNPYTYPNHSGIDFPQARGTLVRASGRGRVTLRSSNPRGGNMVWVEYDAHPSQNGTGYAHLDNYNDSPPVGSVVNEGDALCRVGNTGNSTGPHLHMEVAGYATTAGFWNFYDPNRVVGGGSGSGTVDGDQRVAGPNGVKARTAPSTAQPAVEGKGLDPGAVGTFDGWIRGEAVQGNDIWYRGAFSGLFFWSGGFTKSDTSGLPDINPPTLGGRQRMTGPNGANQRPEPRTSSPVQNFIAPNVIGDFNGWIHGELVQGQSVWFRGEHSGLFSWAGGFTDQGTHDLDDLNPVTPPPASRNRTVAVNPANVRDLPYTDSPVISSAPGGTVIEMDGWTRAESVQGIDLWYRRTDGDWMWAGGFTAQTTDGLLEIPTPPKPQPPSKHNPLGLPTYPPIYPRAVIGLQAPLGFENCKIGGVRASRKTKGNPPVATTGVISYLILHWAWPAGDDTRYFSTCNERGSCPTIYVNTDAEALEFIRPGSKPAATGAEWNWRSWAIEVEPRNGGDDPNVPPFTEAQVNEIIEQMVFLREHSGGTLDGAPVDFTLDREHVLGHRDVAVVDCPGDWLYARIPEMIAEAQRRYDERHPAEPGETIAVPRTTLEIWRDEHLASAAEITGLLSE